MRDIMLIQLWERLRGYDKWVDAEAKIESAELAEVNFPGTRDRREKRTGPIGWKSECRIFWRDPGGGQHQGWFEADEESPLYQLVEGDTLNIRVNPESPDHFYARPLLESNFASARKK
jgi:hypothetical protein